MMHAAHDITFYVLIASVRSSRAATHGILLFAALAALLIGGLYLHRRQRTLVESAGIPDDIPPEALANVPPGGADKAEQPPSDREEVSPKTEWEE